MNQSPLRRRRFSVWAGILLCLFCATAVAQNAAARKRFAETVRKEVIRKLGSNIAPGFNITADGPDSTIYTYQAKGVTYSDCNRMFATEGFVEDLGGRGFSQVVCTDGANARFTSDLIGQHQSQQSAVPANAPGYPSFSDGTHIVGQDVSPGTYRTRVGSPGCYYARLAGFSGTLGDIIANANIDAPAVVTILPTDKGFVSKNCGIWTEDLSAITTSGTPIGDGNYIVGTDIQPGIYRNSGQQGCYYARLSGFGGVNGETIANAIADSSAIVTISPTDKGFQSSRCGIWTLLSGAQLSAPPALTEGTTNREAPVALPKSEGVSQNCPEGTVRVPTHYGFYCGQKPTGSTVPPPVPGAVPQAASSQPTQPSVQTPSVQTSQPFIATKGKIPVKIEVVEQSQGMQGKYQLGGLYGAIQGEKTYTTATLTRAIINGDHATLMCDENHKGTLKGCDFLGVGTYDGEMKSNSHSEPDVWIYYIRPVDHKVIREHWKVSGSW